MRRRWFVTTLFVTALSVTTLVLSISFLAPEGIGAARAANPDRDFSGKWELDQAASRIRAFAEVETSLTISQDDRGILCSNGAAKWRYPLDGSETRQRAGSESRNSATKWEGSALLINTLVSGPQDYTVMERWAFSHDHATLTIT